MADEVILNNLSDDADSKQYISNTLMPQVFHDIPLNVLNTGFYSIVNEYMSQVMEQMSFTQAFYFNESFITKAALPDSIYSEAAIFNIGYSYAIPSTCNFLLEINVEDLIGKKNATWNADRQVYEFILDKNTKLNLPNGNIYSLDYDILIQYMNPEHPVWSVQYLMNDDMNTVATNKTAYILYRVTDTWLCLYVRASEIERTTYTVVNNMTNGIPNEDYVIECANHIAGFDIKYIENDGTGVWIPHDHILPIHADVTDDEPYIHYIMDNPQTIRFMFQLNGNRRWIPKLNSRFEITVYTCHGKSANFTSFDGSEQPNVITSTTRYANNGNVRKAAYIISPSMNGTDIGNVETTRRETIEAYNTANVISSDHDIEEWLKTFAFKNLLYPFFFKRRDDPWGRIWSGFIALKDTDNRVFRTNTLHAQIPYRVLYNNNNNTVTDNEIIIPPGWTWVYQDTDVNRYTVIPYTQGDGKTVEPAKTLSTISDRFVFANPFGIRVQKDPFAVGYFNPWINQATTSTAISKIDYNISALSNDRSVMYHAVPLIWWFTRSYMNDYYNISTFISPTITTWVDGTPLAKYVRKNVVPPAFVNSMWTYFKQPTDLYAPDIPILTNQPDEGYLAFDPENTYLCVRSKNKIDDNTWSLNNIWIEDGSEDPTAPLNVLIPITGDVTMLWGSDDIWGENGISHGVAYENSVDIGISPQITSNVPIVFSRVENLQYYEMRIRANAIPSETTGAIIDKIVVGSASKTELTKYGETELWLIGGRYQPSVYINIYFADGTMQTYNISNTAAIYMPYEFTENDNGEFEVSLTSVRPDGIILYADMKPAPSENAYDHYRVKFSDMTDANTAMFYIRNKLLPVAENNMRVILHAYMDGMETGWVEMQPVELETDGSYRFDVAMYSLDELIDVDSRIRVASITNGGGSWHSTSPNSVVTIDAENPEFRVTILVRVEGDVLYNPGGGLDSEFTGFRIVDEFTIDTFPLIQELKEMRSVVKFDESTTPTQEQISAYDFLMTLSDPNPNGFTFYDIRQYFYHLMNGTDPEITFAQLKRACSDMVSDITNIVYFQQVITLKDKLNFIYMLTTNISKFAQTDADVLTEYNKLASVTDGTWEDVYNVYSELNYKTAVNETFETANVNGGVEIQLMPFVSQDLMVSDRFDTFVSSFTQVHTAIEPVIFKRLEGNNYLDCKLIATYGLPHSYCADLNKDIKPGNANAFWPDLDVQIAFDVKLYNNALESNTLSELRDIVKAYFNRLTTIHTPADQVSMDNNIYVSQLIHQMETHDNVAYLKFKGWYVTEKNDKNGNYMNADYQAIVQKWNTLESMPTDELERYVPEMFVLEDSNIILQLL